MNLCIDEAAEKYARDVKIERKLSGDTYNLVYGAFIAGVNWGRNNKDLLKWIEDEHVRLLTEEPDKFELKMYKGDRERIQESRDNILIGLGEVSRYYAGRYEQMKMYLRVANKVRNIKERNKENNI